jgi:hypothetical protein
MRRRAPSSPAARPGRICAFCGKKGGEGFPPFLIERFGGTYRSHLAHSACFKAAKDAFNESPEAETASDRAPRRLVGTNVTISIEDQHGEFVPVVPHVSHAAPGRSLTLFERMLAIARGEKH